MLADGEIVADGATAEVVVASPAFAPQVAKIMLPDCVADGRARCATRCAVTEASGVVSATIRRSTSRPGRTACCASARARRSCSPSRRPSSLAMFCWPLLLHPPEGFAHSSDAPFVFIAVLPALIAVVLAELGERGIDGKTMAMLGVCAAIGAALRPLGAGTAGVETVFFLLVLAGRVVRPGLRLRARRDRRSSARRC